MKLHLETETKKLFESRKVLTLGAALPTPDVKLHLLKQLTFSMSKFCLIKTLDNI